MTTPATKIPGTLLSCVTGSMVGLLVSGLSVIPRDRRNSKSGWYPVSAKTWSAGNAISPAGPETMTRPSSMRFTCVSKSPRIWPALIRFSIPGPPHHDYIQTPERMRFGVVMRDVRQIFAGNAETIGKVIIARGHGNFLACKLRGVSVLIPRVHAEFSVASLNSLHAVGEAQFQIIVLHALAIIFERLGTSRLFRGTRKRQIADFQKFGRGEEHHIDWIMVDGVAEASFVDHQRTHSRSLGLNRTG